MFLTLAVSDSYARVGKGKSSGFREYKSDRYSQPSQRQDQQTFNKAPQQPLQKPSFFNSGIFKMLVGGLVIGALMSMFMGQGFQFGAPGILEILIIASILFFIVRKIMQKRQAESYQYATGSHAFSERDLPGAAETTETSTVSINENFIKDVAKSTYKALQDAWTQGDLTPVKNLMTERMYSYLNEQVQQMKTQGVRNTVEIIYLQNIEVVEADEEGDGKVVVVQIDALLRDYTTDNYGNLVEGSKDTPVDVREYWAFVGKGLDWKLDDIKQA
jgi:predicted lipid-binding transport protein (Tim44 family)